MRPRASAGCLAAALLGASPALAGGPPYATDDAVVLGPGEAEFIAYADLLARPGADRGEAGIDASIGIAEGLQLGVIVPLHAIATGPDRFAPGDVVVQAKLLLAGQEGGGAALALGPALALPTAAAGRADPGLDLPVWLSIGNGDWSFHAGGGWRLAGKADGGDLPFAGIVARRALEEGTSIGAEFHVEGGADGGKARAMAGPGFSHALSRTISLVAAGHAILTDRDTHGDFHAFVALVMTPG